jgi:hypothetical protein
MRHRYLRFKKWALLKMIYGLAAVMRFLKRQVPGGDSNFAEARRRSKRRSVRVSRRRGAVPSARRRSVYAKR